MDLLKITLFYVLPTFPLAYFWHLHLFKKQYTSWEYATKPSPPLGLLSMVLQGFLLAVPFTTINASHEVISAGMFALLMGMFHGSIHVVAAMAKNKASRNVEFFALETVFLTLQFGIFAALVSAFA